MRLGQKKGLTLLEILLALSLVTISMIGFLYVYKTTSVDKEKKEIVSKLLFDISRIETAFLHYYSVRSAYPIPDQNGNILGNNTDFTIHFLKPPMPQVPINFDYTYGNNGFKLSNNTQGYFLCLRVKVNNANDIRFLALKEIANNFPTKAYYHYSNSANDIESENCPAIINKPDPTIPRIVYLTYWITRQ